MDGFNNLPCLKVDITSQGLNGTVVKGQYNDFSIQGNISELNRVNALLICSVDG